MYSNVSTGEADIMHKQRLREKEEVLLQAFRNAHPEKQDFLVDMAVDFAKDFVKNGPKLTLVANSPAPLVLNTLRRSTG